MAARNQESCPTCGAAMRRGLRPTPFRYKGQETVVDQPGWYCEGCGEGVLSQEDLAATQPVLHAFKAKVEGVMTPSEVRAVRKRLKLSQRRAGALLGGGERSFQKYESGTVMVSHAMSNLLRVLAAEPSLLGVLTDERKPSHEGQH